MTPAEDRTWDHQSEGESFKTRESFCRLASPDSSSLSDRSPSPAIFTVKKNTNNLLIIYIRIYYLWSRLRVRLINLTNSIDLISVLAFSDPQLKTPQPSFKVDTKLTKNVSLCDPSHVKASNASWKLLLLPSLKCYCAKNTVQLWAASPSHYDNHLYLLCGSSLTHLTMGLLEKQASDCLRRPQPQLSLRRPAVNHCAAPLFTLPINGIHQRARWNFLSCLICSSLPRALVCGAPLCVLISLTSVPERWPRFGSVQPLVKCVFILLAVL